MRYLVLILLLAGCTSSGNREGCSDECSEEDSRCHENAVQACRTSDEGCLEWYDVQYCGVPPLYSCVEDETGAHCVGGFDAGGW